MSFSSFGDYVVLLDVSEGAEKKTRKDFFFNADINVDNASAGRPFRLSLQIGFLKDRARSYLSN